MLVHLGKSKATSFDKISRVARNDTEFVIPNVYEESILLNYLCLPILELFGLLIIFTSELVFRFRALERFWQFW